MTTLTDRTAPAVVPTKAFAEIAQALDFAVPRGEIVLVHGEVGTGRRTAVREVLATRPEPTSRVDLDADCSANDLVHRLYDTLIAGEDHPVRDMQNDLVQALTTSGHILVLTHVERLTRDTAALMHWLHEQSQSGFTPVLIGGPATLRAIHRDALLAGSLSEEVVVRKLTGDDLVSVLQRMHPLLGDADPNLLHTIDQQALHGLLSRWTLFLNKALAIRQQAHDTDRPGPPLDRTLARAVLGRMPGSRRAAS